VEAFIWLDHNTDPLKVVGVVIKPCLFMRSHLPQNLNIPTKTFAQNRHLNYNYPKKSEDEMILSFSETWCLMFKFFISALSLGVQACLILGR
jgi:hypothetical protein